VNLTRVLSLVAAVGAAVPIASIEAQTSPPSAQASTTPAASPQSGRDLYAKYSCYACHGYDGHGGAGARLVPMRMSLPAFTAYVHNPRQMPPYTTKVLSDAQLADIWAHIKSLPESPAAKNIPLLAQILSEK
jgi:mono/diheme cytochrome c family protein